jgi:iron donor protein CyaY
MPDELHFHAYADATLQHVYDQLEQAYDDGTLEDLDLEEGLLSIVTASEKTFILSKHGPSRQLWLASPLSGGLHFDFSSHTQEWQLPDGRLLKDILAADLKQSAALQVRF